MAGVIFGKSIWARYQSMPDGLYGGPFHQHHMDSSRKTLFDRKFHSWINSRQFLRIDIHNPPGPMNLPGFKANEAEYHLLSLDRKPLQPPRKSVTKHIRTGEKRGGRVCLIEDRSQIDDLFAIIEKAAKKHGQKPRYPKEFFEALLKLSLTDKRIMWPGMAVDDKIVAFRICFIERSRILSWQYYADPKYLQYKPSYMLLDHIIKYARENRIKAINLGWTPPGTPSLVQFKEAWGARPTRLVNFSRFGPLGKLVYRWR